VPPHGGAALLAIGGLIGASFVKSPQQIAADTAAPPPTVTTAKVVSQILTSSVQMRGVVYPGTQYDVYPSAPESDSAASDTGSAAGGSAAGGSATGGSPGAVYISRLDVAAGQRISNGEQLASIDGEPLFALAGRVPAWRDITPGESGPDVAELQKAPGPGPSGGPFGNLPAAAQAAAGKCFNILENFNNAQFAHSISIIETLNNYISTDVIQDSQFKKADGDWSACMAKNGFSSPGAESFWQQALNTIGQGQGPSGPPAPPTAAQNKAQIAMAVADANCTLSSDLAGIYFAVQANYEQQFVSANQQALNAGIREYKAAFAKALTTMPSLLQTASATPSLPGPPRGHHGRHPGTAETSPSHS